MPGTDVDFEALPRASRCALSPGYARSAQATRAPFACDLGGIADFCGDGARRARWSRKPQSGRRTRHTVDCIEYLARRHMRVRRCLAQGQHRRETRVTSFEQVAPFAARTLRERLLQNLPQARPRFGIQSILERFLIETQASDQNLVELRFERADRDVFAVGAAIRRVERRPAIEQVAAALVAPFASRDRGVDERKQRRGAVDDRSIDDLAAAGALCLEKCREDADDQIQRAAAEIAE